MRARASYKIWGRRGGDAPVKPGCLRTRLAQTRAGSRLPSQCAIGERAGACACRGQTPEQLHACWSQIGENPRALSQEMDRFWLLIWTTYGSWLPGDRRGSVARLRAPSGRRVAPNTPGTPPAPPTPNLE